MANSLITDRKVKDMRNPLKKDKPKESEEVPEETRKGFTKVVDGPTTGYRDGKDGVIEVATFADGWIPDGWKDTPAECKNNGGKHVEVKVDSVVAGEAVETEAQ